MPITVPPQHELQRRELATSRLAAFATLRVVALTPSQPAAFAAS